VVVVFGQPLTVPRDAGREIVETKRRELEAVLLGITAAADRAARGADVPPL
jgi:hypothetical protein